MGHHAAFIVDPAALSEVTALVKHVITVGDRSPLERYFTVKSEEQSRARDAASVPLELKVLLRAIELIRELEDSPLAAAREGKALLDAVYGTSLRPRDVSENAFVQLLPRANRLARLLKLNAPQQVVVKAIELAHQGLVAMDEFDLTDRRGPGSEVEDAGTLVRRCLELLETRDTDHRVPGSPWELAVLGGVELFPPPRDPVEFARWIRLCRGFSRADPPRVASGDELSHGAELIQGFQRQLPRMGRYQALDVQSRVAVESRFDAYLHLAVDAGRRRLSVIEWVWPEDDDGATAGAA